MQGETFQNTSWINHFETQNIKIGGLNNGLYEFKTVGRNDYPDDNDVNSRSESPASNVTEGRPLPSPASKYRTLLTEQHSLGNVSVLTALQESIMRQSWILDSTPWIPDCWYWIIVFVSGPWVPDFNR